MPNLNVSNVKICELSNSEYVIPFKVIYTQDGKPKFWDLVEIHPSVSVILYNRERDCLVCVKQFRPGVYFNSVPKAERVNEIDTNKYPSSLGMTVEFCSGIVDKKESLRKIAVDEIREETGYVVNEASLREVQSFRSAIGISGDITTMFYTEITDQLKLYPGGGIEEELIEVIELTMDEAKEILQHPSPAVPVEFLYGLRWFFTNIRKLEVL
uniref:Uridine diphosphate glucose pyrophosphatase NUDT14 n=1 Tax=Triatoma infestans TaxID=30076 RepID=A0A023F7I3_TRIIF